MKNCYKNIMKIGKKSLTSKKTLKVNLYTMNHIFKLK